MIRVRCIAKRIFERINGGPVLITSDLEPIHENKTAETVSAGKFEGEIVTIESKRRESTVCEIAGIIWIEMKCRQMSPAGLAKEAGVSRNFVRSLLAGKSALNAHKLYRVTNVLGLHPEDVLFTND